MSKRSTFEKKPRDSYETVDPKALPETFLRFIRGTTYAEPNCGSGQLVNNIGTNAVCRWASDIEPLGFGSKWDAMCLTEHQLEKCEVIITNPPYTRDVLLPLIDHYVSLRPTWLLLPAGHAHNIYFSPYMKKCSMIISLGRLCWFPKDGKRVASKDDYAWYFWERNAKDDTDTIFIGR